MKEENQIKIDVNKKEKEMKINEKKDEKGNRYKWKQRGNKIVTNVNKLENGIEK